MSSSCPLHPIQLNRTQFKLRVSAGVALLALVLVVLDFFAVLRHRRDCGDQVLDEEGSRGTQAIMLHWHECHHLLEAHLVQHQITLSKNNAEHTTKCIWINLFCFHNKSLLLCASLIKNISYMEIHLSKIKTPSRKFYKM